MNLKMPLLAFILPAVILSVSCKKNNNSSSGTHTSITGQWLLQYTYGAWPDTFYAPRDSSIEIAFTSTDSFSLSFNGNKRASGTWQWQDTILVLTSSAAINDADYAQSIFFNGTNPSEYFVKLASNGLQLSKNFIIPGATTPYMTPIEPQIMVFTWVSNSASMGIPAN